jgi:hypothetical protein
MRSALFAALPLLAACVGTSKVVPEGQVVPGRQGTYMISGLNLTCGNCEPPEYRAKEQARAYCAQSGKVMDTARQRFDTGTGYRYTLTFACLSKLGPGEGGG